MKKNTIGVKIYCILLLGLPELRRKRASTNRFSVADSQTM